MKNKMLDRSNATEKVTYRSNIEPMYEKIQELRKQFPNETTEEIIKRIRTAQSAEKRTYE